VATELRARADHPALKAVEAHREAMRRLLEDVSGRAGCSDPAVVAGQLVLLIEAAALAQLWPTGADDVRALAGAVLVAAAAAGGDA
jgi:hypothetical protein